MSSYQGVRLKPWNKGDHLGLVEPLGRLFVAWRHRRSAGMRHARHDKRRRIGCRSPGIRRYPTFAEIGRQLPHVHDRRYPVTGYQGENDMSETHRRPAIGLSGHRLHRRVQTARYRLGRRHQGPQQLYQPRSLAITPASYPTVSGGPTRRRISSSPVTTTTLAPISGMLVKAAVSPRVGCVWRRLLEIKSRCAKPGITLRCKRFIRPSAWRKSISTTPRPATKSPSATRPQRSNT